MLTYNLEERRGPLYEQLYQAIRDDIRTGRIAPGERLPSKRAFAENLGVSTITVEGAYRQLALEGYIHTEPKRGSFAAELPQPEVRRGLPEPVIKAEKTLTADPEFELSGNRTAAEGFPFSVWSKLLRETVSDRKAFLRRSPAAGLPELKESIAEHLRAFRGISASPAQIVVGAGSDNLYARLIQLLGTQRIFCLEDPGYRAVDSIYRSFGARCVYAGTDSAGLIPEELRKSGADTVHISPAHHFPTGICMPAARRYELLAWANEAPDRFIIEDDYDCEFRLEGRPVPALQSLDAAGRVIYMNTFTKSLSSTVRAAYMVLPPALLERFREDAGFVACPVSNFEQLALARFISRGHFERHISRMRSAFARKRRAVLSAFQQSPLAGRCAFAENRAGLHFILKLDTELPDAELSRRMAEKSVHLAPLSDFSAGHAPVPSHAFVFCYSDISLETLPEALKRIASCLEP